VRGELGCELPDPKVRNRNVCITTAACHRDGNSPGPGQQSIVLGSHDGTTKPFHLTEQSAISPRQWGQRDWQAGACSSSGSGCRAGYRTLALLPEALPGDTNLVGLGRRPLPLPGPVIIALCFNLFFHFLGGIKLI
jgi:hypothetical protein